MKKIIFGIVMPLILIVFSSCSNDESFQEIKGSEITAIENIPQSQNATANLETLDEQQIIKNAAENLSQSSHNGIQSDAEISNKKSKPLESTTYIEQGCIDLLKNTLDNNNEYEILKGLVSDKLLTKEEFSIIDLGGTEDYLIERLEDGSRYSLYHQAMLVDADNDGIDDIVVYLHSGGSAGFVDLFFLKGDRDGTFKKTYSSPFGIYTENAFVKYNGKNYFLLTSVDYNRKIKTGFDLYCFANGVLKESASIQKAPESYILSEKMVASDEYITLADKLSETAPAIYFDIDDYEEDNIIGSGETKLSDDKAEKTSKMRKSVQGNSILIISSWYNADIDNDGIYETYSKGLFWPSNNFTYRHLTPYFFKDSREYNLQNEGGLDIWVDNRIPQHLWVERVSKKNIICVLSTKGFNEENIKSKDEFVVDCYYIQNNICQTVVKLEFSPSYKMNIEVYTQDINKDFIKEGASDLGKG